MSCLSPSSSASEYLSSSSEYRRPRGRPPLQPWVDFHHFSRPLRMAQQDGRKERIWAEEGHSGWKVEVAAEEGHSGGKRKVGDEEGHSGGKRGAGVERIKTSTSAIILAMSLGLGGSSDSEEDNVCEGGLRAEDSMDIVADERHLVEVGESSYGVGECESEGLTEEVGVMRGEVFDPGMLDEEWRQKTLALNGEEIANSIYHVPGFTCLPRVVPLTILPTAMLGFI